MTTPDAPPDARGRKDAPVDDPQGTTVEVTLSLWFPTQDDARARIMAERLLSPLTRRAQGTVVLALTPNTTNDTESALVEPVRVTQVRRGGTPSPDRLFRRGPRTP